MGENDRPVKSIALSRLPVQEASLMRTGSAAIDIQAAPDAVFDLVHDYDRRLDWDWRGRNSGICGNCGK
jgi:hypothetical protein